MNATEIMDNLSDTLLGDDRILSGQEKDLLSGLLLRAKTNANGNGHLVTDAISRSVGEIVVQRVFGVLGESLTRRLTQNLAGARTMPDRLGRLHGPGPQPGPFPPSPAPPGPHGIVNALQAEARNVATADQAERLPADFLLLEEFLAPAELSALLQYAFDQEADFQLSEVISPGVTGGIVDHEYRRSRVLLNLDKHRAVVVNRIQSFWPRILERLGHTTFAPTDVEIQITASNDGDFFRWHSDNGHEVNAPRELTFVYFFHREPKPFRGGELRIYDSRLEGGGYIPTETYRTIVPQQNQMVVFASSLAHEITAVDCSSKAFADSRFTVNGWFHK